MHLPYRRAVTSSSPASTAHRRGALLALAGACLWGTTGTSQALLTGQHSPVAVGGLRTLTAAALLTGIAVISNPRKWLAPLGHDSRRWILPAGLSVACYQLTFFAALARTGVAVGTLVMLATTPAVAGLLGWRLEGLRPSRLWLTATLTSLLGAALLVLGSGASAPLDALGLLLAVVAGICFGSYSVAGRRAASGGDDPLVLSSWIFVVAALVLAAPLLRQDLTFVTPTRNLVVLGWLGLAATAGAYLLYQTGMRSIDAATAATLALAEPMVANLLAVLVLGEPFTALMGLGVILVLGGLGLLGRA